MEKWFERVSVFLLAIFGLLYLGAKRHFFARYGAIGPGEYLEEHWFFWAGMAIVAGAGACLGWIRKRFGHPKSK
jgi:hypothetical protein